MNATRRASIVVLLLVAACTSARSGATPRPASATDSLAPSADAVELTHATGPSEGCNATPAAPAGTRDDTIVSSGVERVYQLTVPASYDGRTPYAVVFALHALTVPYPFAASIAGFDDMASNYAFIGVAPSGRLDGPTPFWNAAPAADNYDVTFIGELLDHLEATLCIDEAHVFSTGMSNGSQMSSLLGCRLPDRITAIGLVAGVEFLAPCDGAPVSVIAFHGTADPILPYAGGGLNATAIADAQFYKGHLPPGLPAPLGVDESMRLWAEHNRCDPDYTEERISPEVRRRTWQHCAAPTVLYIIDGGGHAWPGKPVPAFEAQFGHATTDIDASSLIFAFFFGR